MEAIAERSISKWWLRGLAVLLTASPPALLLWFQDALKPLLSAAAPEVVLRILAGLLLTTLALLAFILLERPWLKWDETCRSKKLFSPLKNEVTGWRCVVCGTFRTDPARKAKESPPALPQGPHSWMAR
jgi:uncharacterized membrane protein